MNLLSKSYFFEVLIRIKKLLANLIKNLNLKIGA